MIQLSDIEKVLGSVIHPEYDKSVIELSLVQNLAYQNDSGEDNAGTIKFRLVFHRNDPMANSIKEACQKALNEAFPKTKTSILVLIDTNKNGRAGIECCKWYRAEWTCNSPEMKRSEQIQNSEQITVNCLREVKDEDFND